jgi:uncharacterized protein YjlB
VKAPALITLASNERFPNSCLPALLYRGVFSPALEDLARAFEQRFTACGWRAAWRDGLYSVHHYHSTAHEALGVYAGWVTARLGGDQGEVLTLSAGDALVMPAGVAHKNEAQSPDFRAVGAYANGSDFDMCYGAPGERAAAERRIGAVALPVRDPVFGAGGPLVEAWSAARGLPR